MLLATLFEWWNFIFALPLAVGLVFGLGLAITGLAGEIGTSHNGDGDELSHEIGHAEHEVGHVEQDVGHMEHEVGHVEQEVAHAEQEVGHHEFSHEGGQDDETDHEAPHLLLSNPFSLLFQALSFFGIGRGVPLSVMLPSLMVIWGVSGLILNGVLLPLLRNPFLFAPLSVAGTLVLTSFAGRGLARTMRRLLGTEKPSAITKSGLVGCSGRAVFRITSEGGVANVKDPFGNIHRIVCKVKPGLQPIEAESKILVVQYLPEEGCYYVELYPFEELFSPPKQLDDAEGQRFNKI